MSLGMRPDWHGKTASFVQKKKREKKKKEKKREGGEGKGRKFRNYGKHNKLTHGVC